MQHSVLWSQITGIVDEIVISSSNCFSLTTSLGGFIWWKFNFFPITKVITSMYNCYSALPNCGLRLFLSANDHVTTVILLAEMSPGCGPHSSFQSGIFVYFSFSVFFFFFFFFWGGGGGGGLVVRVQELLTRRVLSNQNFGELHDRCWTLEKGQPYLLLHAG